MLCKLPSPFSITRQDWPFSIVTFAHSCVLLKYSKINTKRMDKFFEGSKLCTTGYLGPAGCPLQQGVFVDVGYCGRSNSVYTAEDGILQQMLEVSCQPLAWRGRLSTWRFGQFLLLLKLIDFGIILDGQHNQSSRGVSPTRVIKSVYKLLSQYFIGHSFNWVCTFQTYKINIDFLC